MTVFKNYFLECIFKNLFTNEALYFKAKPKLKP